MAECVALASQLKLLAREFRKAHSDLRRTRVDVQKYKGAADSASTPASQPRPADFAESIRPRDRGRGLAARLLFKEVARKRLRHAFKVWTAAVASQLDPASFRSLREVALREVTLRHPREPLGPRPAPRVGPGPLYPGTAPKLGTINGSFKNGV
ncbi:hypothetical protein M885DRAFT_591081 [Pelagophyceae sp. CCMP2097]|nr:hypothetical protein M885DRAFT_591081 [Pelagophyceae sp. CCMP2097]